jgi:hypothetical protein
LDVFSLEIKICEDAIPTIGTSTHYRGIRAQCIKPLNLHQNSLLIVPAVWFEPVDRRIQPRCDQADYDAVKADNKQAAPQAYLPGPQHTGAEGLLKHFRADSLPMHDGDCHSICSVRMLPYDQHPIPQRKPLTALFAIAAMKSPGLGRPGLLNVQDALSMLKGRLAGTVKATISGRALP